MRLPWFKRYGIFFVPVGAIGWILLLGAVVYAIIVFRDIDRQSHSVSDTFINWVFNMLILAAVYSTIGFFTSRRNE